MALQVVSRGGIFVILGAIWLEDGGVFWQGSLRLVSRSTFLVLTSFHSSHSFCSLHSHDHSLHSRSFCSLHSHVHSLHSLHSRNDSRDQQQPQAQHQPHA